MMKFTVVTPSFNQAEFIPATIESVLSQAGEFELEYIVMDGGSKDGSVEIIKEYARKVESGEWKPACRRLTMAWKSEKDRGQSDAINKGLRAATGDVVAYLNSDDLYLPGALEAARTALESSGAQWCYGKCVIVDRQGKEFRRWVTAYKNLVGGWSYPKLLAENFICQMSVFWRRDVHGRIGYFDENEHLCMDYDFWLRLGKEWAPARVGAVLAAFRLYSTSKSGARYVQQFQDELRVARKHAAGKHPFATFLHALNRRKIVAAYKLLDLLKS